MMCRGAYKQCYRKRECVSELVYRMCEENAVEKLMAFNFAGFADEVEDALAFKSRNADPRVRPFYSRILYTWYVLRGDYRNCKSFRLCPYLSSVGLSSTMDLLAALTMYQRARKLHDLIGDPAHLLALAEEQLEAYAVAINSLALLDRPNAWIIMPITNENGREVRIVELCLTS
jgi:nuclear pore complex protein Nup160